MNEREFQRTSVQTEQHYRRLVARGGRQTWTAEDERRLRERCEQLRARRDAR